MNFLRTTKLDEAVGQVQFAVLEKLTSAYLHQIALESMLLLVLVYEKRITESRARAICNLHRANQTHVIFSCILLEA